MTTIGKTETFEARFSNGYWKVFDTEEYRSVQLCYLKSEAVKAAKTRNLKKAYGS